MKINYVIKDIHYTCIILISTPAGHKLTKVSMACSEYSKFINILNHDSASGTRASARQHY